MKRSIQIILFLAQVLLAYLLFESIMKPIRFNREKDIRYKAAIAKLIDIRKAQVAYKAKYGRYASNFTDLINYVKNDSLPVVRAVGDVPDSLTEKEALKLGIIIRDTIRVSVLDTIFSPQYPIDSLPYVPYTLGDTFRMGAGEIETGSKVKVKVFEASVTNDVLLKGLDEQLIVNFSDMRMKVVKFPGLKVGSLTEANNNAGNWE